MGMKVMTDSTVEGVDTSGTGCTVKVKTKKGEEEIKCDIVLSAVGIVANIENIGLEDVGIATDRGKIIVNDYYQTNIPGIYAAGECDYHYHGGNRLGANSLVACIFTGLIVGSGVFLILRTERLDIEPDTRNAMTTEDVTLEFEGRQIDATGMQANFETNSLKLLSNVNGRFLPE